MNKSARNRPFVLVFAIVAVLFLVSMASVLYATLSVNRTQKGESVAVVGDLKATVGAGSITVTNDMDCVLRATPIGSGVSFDTTNWYAQSNGWYYYYKVIGKNDSTKTITLSGATSDNVQVELMQAQYLKGENSKVTAGFITEWASRDVINTKVDAYDNAMTSDGIALANPTAIMMFSGHAEDRRVPEATYQDNDRLRATKVTDSDDSYFKFDKINITGDSSFETINKTTAIALYNNSTVSVVFMIQIIDGGTQPTKKSEFSNGNWTTYVRDSNKKYTKAASSDLTSGYDTFFVSKAVAPGAYIELTNGSDNKLYFDSLTTTSNETTIHLTVSSVDTLTFDYAYDSTAGADNYLSWLKSLGDSYYKDFITVFSE